MNTRNQEVDELKQLIDDANASQDLIDELSDKNLNLTEVLYFIIYFEPICLFML